MGFVHSAVRNPSSNYLRGLTLATSRSRFKDKAKDQSKTQYIGGALYHQTDFAILEAALKGKERGQPE